jgi:hypothetical protein
MPFRTLVAIAMSQCAARIDIAAAYDATTAYAAMATDD